MLRHRTALALCLLLGCGASNTNSAEVSPARDTPAAPSPAPQKPRPSGTPQPTLAIGTVELSVAPREPLKLKVEVARTDEQRQQGLMFRERLGDDEGMLFVFPTERYNSFWMHNTLIPLDMYFIDSEWNVVGVVEQATPLTDDPRQVPKMSQYVLEVRGGFARAHGLGEGAKVKFVPPAGEGAP
jgi:uncharacterized protein